MAHQPVLEIPKMVGIGDARERTAEADGPALPPGTVVVSADSHWLEGDIWVERFPPHLRDRAPRVFFENGGWEVELGGRRLTPPGSAAASCAFECVPGFTDIAARLRDLDAEGVQQELIFPQKFFHLIFLEDFDEKEWCVRAYNEALAVMTDREDFALNSDSKSLNVVESDCEAQECAPFVVLNLVPTTEPLEEVDSKDLFRWVTSSQWPEFHPLAGEDKRPRDDGVIVRFYNRPGQQSMSRYTYLTSSGYVEWGRALGGCYQDVCCVRLGPLLWATSHLYEFLAEFKDRWKTRSEYDLVVSVARARGTCLSHLGQGWLEPFELDYRPYRPTCLDYHVQYRVALATPLGEASRRQVLLDCDRYLNAVWGDGDARGHDRPNRGNPDEFVLSDKYRLRDPWE